MSVQILDYSWARPSPQSCKDFPAIGVMRYVGPGNNGRDITQGELEALHSVGLGVGLVWESTANRALAGYDAGVYDADQAAYWADRLGWPEALPIYYACDCDVSTGDAYGKVLDYFRGTTTGAYEARAYGEADVLDATGQSLAMPYGWQPAATSWSNNRISDNAGMLQQWPYVMNEQCDNNIVTCSEDEIDWLWYGGAVTGGDEMTDAEWNKMASLLNTMIVGKLAAHSTPNVLITDENGQFLIVMVDGQPHRYTMHSPAEVTLAQKVGFLAPQKPVAPPAASSSAYNVRDLSAEERDVLYSYPTL
jgi:Domain of unknown function (DUF1906)